MIITKKLEIKTKGNTDIINITDKVQSIFKDLKIKEGAINLFIPSTTASLNIIEYEAGHIQDLKKTFKSIAPEKKPYHHNDGNGHSHICASFLPQSLTIPFQNSELLLGTWQQIVLIDFDIRPRTRKVIVQIQGE